MSLLSCAGGRQAYRIKGLHLLTATVLRDTIRGHCTRVFTVRGASATYDYNLAYVLYTYFSLIYSILLSCGLFNGAVRNTWYIALTDKIVTTNELDRIRH